MLIVLSVSCQDEAEVDYGILLAVPSDAGVIVKASDPCELCTALSENSLIWAQLNKLPRLQNAAQAITKLDTIARNNNSIRSLLKGKSAMVSFHKEGKSLKIFLSDFVPWKKLEKFSPKFSKTSTSCW